METTTEQEKIVSPFIPETSVHENNKARQEMFWEFYAATVAEGTPNILQSAIKAGFTPDSAGKVGKTKWFKEKDKKVFRGDMLDKAEKNLKEILSLPYLIKKKKDGEEYYEVDTDILKLVLDTSKAIVKSLGKDEGYSERSEVTGKGGEPVVFMPIELLNKHQLTNNEEK